MIRINLIPREARPDRTIYYELFLGVLILALTVLVVVVWWIKLNDEIATLKDDIQRKKEELKKLEYVRKKVEEFEQKKTLLERKRDTIINLQRIQRGPVLILMELNRARPQKQVWFTDVSMIGENLVKLRGAGLSYSSIGDFMNELSRRPIFENVKLESSTKEVQGNRQIYRFSMNFNISVAAIEGKKE